MDYRKDVIARMVVLLLCMGCHVVRAAPASSLASSIVSLTTPGSHDPTAVSSPNPYAMDPSNNNSSPTTTIIIVCIIGSVALIGAAWGAYGCLNAKRKPAPTVAITTGVPRELPTTTMICIPGETITHTAMPSLRYNSPYGQTNCDPEPDEVGPGVILPPPPSYDMATGGRRAESSVDGSSVATPCIPIRTRSDSQWKGLLVSQGRD